MDQSFKLVAQKCGDQLSSFQRCILANRADADGGAQACQAQRQALSHCAAEAVPLVSMVKRHCQQQIRVYDACLVEGQQDEPDALTKRCTPALRALWQCTEAVKRQEQIQTGQIPVGGPMDERPM